MRARCRVNQTRTSVQTYTPRRLAPTGGISLVNMGALERGETKLKGSGMGGGGAMHPSRTPGKNGTFRNRKVGRFSARLQNG